MSMTSLYTAEPPRNPACTAVMRGQSECVSELWYLVVCDRIRFAVVGRGRQDGVGLAR